ncbi:ABC transporter ATP-binding protein [Fusobacterium perfoetens]|uniref:betaine/proline/choline family ABC transporter ATP-binding protein n=1 Tax=Fusobacterium perfoetens TaxID=852 RepID=UPI000481A627|nr:ABC transporter ATP-binding protein [Fusobacterium perfoetens]MCI6151684.1 ABC transporter ATP-binding protein [Fusobacterium perfoetens]MDY3236560.1 ABC transporter ATP-binding protein [Fusobacterium perfoetens]
MIEFKNITKNFKGNQVLKGINLKIETGEFVAIIGESGCGKTTLLKMINLLIEPSSGEILIDNEDITKYNVIDLRRRIGYVIQQTGLFPHMTIKENIEIIPRLQKIDQKILDEKTNNTMSMVGLDPEKYLNRYPTELSGGQQQRVGVARAFVTDPEIILMDEPFSALDPITRSDLQDELVSLHSNLKKTIVFVTHDMDEAVKVADKICIMKNGKILQYDTPENILKNPVDDYVSNFVGKNRIWASPEFIKVRDIMIERPITTTKNSTIIQCMEKMRQNKIDSLPVIDMKTRKILGIVKPKDIRRQEDRTLKAEAVMEKEFPKLHLDENIISALKIVNESHSSAVPVIDDKGILKGLITKSSLVTTLSQQYIDVEVD